MIKLDDNLLVEIGLDKLPQSEKAAFLKHMYETLEMRVGTRLAERMSDQQMNDFEKFIGGDTAFAAQQLDIMKAGWQQTPEYQKQVQDGQAKGRAEPAVVAEFAAFTWLETNFPDYKSVVAQEFDKLKGEIAPLAPQILAASQDQGAAVQAPQAPPVNDPGTAQYGQQLAAQPDPQVAPAISDNATQHTQRSQTPPTQQPPIQPSVPPQSQPPQQYDQAA